MVWEGGNKGKVGGNKLKQYVYVLGGRVGTKVGRVGWKNVGKGIKHILILLKKVVGGVGNLVTGVFMIFAVPTHRKGVLRRLGRVYDSPRPESHLSDPQPTAFSGAPSRPGPAGRYR